MATASPQKRATLRREQLGINDASPDVYESAGDGDAPAGGEEAELQRELEAVRKQRKDESPAAPAPIDAAPLEPAAARGLFQARDAACLPPQTDFSLQAHERKRDEWRILGSRERRLETPLDRFTRLLAETQALERSLCLCLRFHLRRGAAANTALQHRTTC
jgi:hypothetical protein